MADYTIKNLMEVENAAAGRGQDMEARFARGEIGSEHLGVSHFRMGPGYRVPFAHRHREQEEVYVVVAGSGRIKIDEEIHDLRQWDLVRLAPGVLRGLEAGPQGMELIMIGSDRPEGGDGEMVEGFWEN